ncbi:DUF1832 domain-containing protein, partial [Salmonella enterica subsp. enterica serovar Kentucky]
IHLHRGISYMINKVNSIDDIIEM